MKKLEALQNFTLKRFNELKNVVRGAKHEEGKLYLGDTFECEDELADYLLGNNDKNLCVVKVLKETKIKEASYTEKKNTKKKKKIDKSKEK